MEVLTITFVQGFTRCFGRSTATLQERDSYGDSYGDSIDSRHSRYSDEAGRIRSLPTQTKVDGF